MSSEGVIRGGNALGRMNRRHPWLKLVLVLLVVEVLVALLVFEPMMKNGKVKIEIPLGESTRQVEQGSTFKNQTDQEV